MSYLNRKLYSNEEQIFFKFWILSSQGGDCEEGGLLGCNAVQSVISEEHFASIFRVEENAMQEGERYRRQTDNCELKSNLESYYECSCLSKTLQATGV
jgi:hypothetical protein